VDNKAFRILALAGSLRQGSYNRGLLRAAGELAPDWVKVQFFDIGTLPFFNEDLESPYRSRGCSPTQGGHKPRQRHPDCHPGV
jgi:NAD(P)H-dependent FMN reductase